VNKILDLAFNTTLFRRQRRIVETLTTIDMAIKSVDEGVIRLGRLKKGLMTLLLTGRVRVVE